MKTQNMAEYNIVIIGLLACRAVCLTLPYPFPGNIKPNQSSIRPGNRITSTNICFLSLPSKRSLDKLNSLMITVCTMAHKAIEYQGDTECQQR